MTKFKKALAIVLSLILVLTVLPAVSDSSEAKAAETFAITSPTNNQLVAAGYIDIVWDAATSSEVKAYELYIDDELVTTTTDTAYEFYTTKVKAFTTYVKVIYTDETSTETEKITFGVSKKGLGLATDMGANLNLRDMGVAWYYNWGTGPSPGQQYKYVEYVPMVWSEASADRLKTRVNSFKNQGYKYVLTYNEPDLRDQCNMSVDAVYSAWQGLDDVTGIKISSPVTSTWPAASEWYQNFANKLDVNEDHDVDFVSIHCYPDGWNGGADMAQWFLETVVDSAWETYHKPIWITEFSSRGSGITNNKTAEFLEYLMPELDKREYVERYAFFGFNRATFNGGLWWYSTGALSGAGEVYKNNGNPANFTAEYPVETFTFTESVRRTLLDDTVSINGVSCEDYTKSEGVSISASSEISSASGAGNIIDESISSRWESVQNVDPQYVIVDLGEVRNIKQLSIVWEAASASKYTVEVSDDGINYKVVAKIEGGSSTQNRNDTIVLNELTSGRYVKINGTARSTEFGYSIFDMAIYGTTDAKVDEPPTTTQKPTTKPEVTTTQKVLEPATTQKTPEATTQQSVETTKSIKVAKTKVKKATKNITSKKAKISIKKINGAKKYQIQISKSKKFKGKNILVKKTVKKINFTITNKKLKNKKKLYIRARAVRVVNGKNYYGKWSNKKKIKIKK